jgi:hypothetical protein
MRKKSAHDTNVGIEFKQVSELQTTKELSIALITA